MNYYSHNIGDYAQATMHLSLIEDAIYSRLLRRYYAEETPIVNDLQQVSRWVGARSEEEREAVTVILNEFFELRDGYWHNKRADAEIAAYKAKAETARVNGSKGGRPKSEPKPKPTDKKNNPKPTNEKPNNNPQETHPVNLANPEETGLKANQEPITNNQYIPPTPLKGDREVFDLPDWVPQDLWSEFETVRKKRKKPMTDRSRRLALGKLETLRDAGDPVKAVMEQSILHAWDTFYPLKPNGSSGAGSATDDRFGGMV